MEDINLKQNFDLGEAALKNFINLTSDEKEMVRQWRNDPEVKKWMYSDHIISQAEHNDFIESLKSNNSKYFWLVRNKDNDDLGVISFLRVDFESKGAYFGIYGNPESKVPGLGRLFDRLAKKLAFDILNFKILKLEVIEDNKGVINLHKKMGFVEEGLLKEYVSKNDVLKNVVVMGSSNG